MTETELNEQYLFFKPEIVFDRTIGGVELVFEVDIFNGHINWSVKQGDHYNDFFTFDEARDYYLQFCNNEQEDKC